MLRTLLLSLIALLLLELSVLVWIVHLIGWTATLAIGIAATLLGGAIARRQRERVWRDWQAVRRSGQAPAADAVDPVLVVASGALLMFPGFLTDVLGLLLLMPPVRRAVGRWLWPLLQRRLATWLAGFGAPPSAARSPRAPSGGSVIDTEGETVPGSDQRTTQQLH